MLSSFLTLTVTTASSLDWTKNSSVVSRLCRTQLPDVWQEPKECSTSHLFSPYSTDLCYIRMYFKISQLNFKALHLLCFLFVNLFYHLTFRWAKAESEKCLIKIHKSWNGWQEHCLAILDLLLLNCYSVVPYFIILCTCCCCEAISKMFRKVKYE